MTEITEGSKAPAFDIPADGGGRATLSGPTVVFFYPKADTPGCTNEAIDFSAHIDAFRAAGFQVIGISRDPVKKLDRFKAKHDLKVILGSDEAEAATEAYGVWVEKTLYGRQYMGVERATFLIDGAGAVRKAWRKVSVKGHAEAVLAVAKEV
ncbi:MAG: peroxiredoxin [Brevundimonas subvibrioides]|uniref:thioredoxin-dependent peroxiredoxin n=1 Tax=Brevundimonas subvibrioides TaxID=74313 RepID=A0A258HJK5_9CAUL|nr:peroxiredoxin [Brevundimonas subvibrioides]OYX56774.1 MAG: peroxiredoxin [Brevundimonas subvibrioides]